MFALLKGKEKALKPGEEPTFTWFKGGQEFDPDDRFKVRERGDFEGRLHRPRGLDGGECDFSAIYVQCTSESSSLKTIFVLIIK